MVFFLIFKLHVTVNILSIGSIIATNTACANMPILAQIGSILNRKVKSRKQQKENRFSIPVIISYPIERTKDLLIVCLL